MESIAPGPKSSDRTSQPASAPQHKTHKAPKNTRKAPKNTRKPQKNTRTAPQNTRKPQQNADAAQQDAARAAHDVLLAEKKADVTPEDKPKVKRIRLVTPSRTGRTVVDLSLIHI